MPPVNNIEGFCLLLLFAPFSHSNTSFLSPLHLPASTEPISRLQSMKLPFPIKAAGEWWLSLGLQCSSSDRVGLLWCGARVSIL